ncbi:MAG: glutamine--tRNA ligase/YqeY domain fusion protein [Oscillospiraceae bacterium]|jgi:glutaminyl-tRNA synthetase|nr:glutamine--tRNA ligase/YqeY domain fusion protein [Oscillospiraceae bacterium]
MVEETNNNFIFDIIKEDLSKNGILEGKKIHTRFPPEPNGHLHIGHAKAIYINFMAAKIFSGVCNLRMDDTNPGKEDESFAQGIKRDVKWLGFDWENRFYRASDYFPQMYKFACDLINKDLCYVCELTPEEVKQNRGDLSNPAISPYRDREKQESIELFKRMKNGEFETGKMTLRAKIDLASGNFNMRDPVIYRIINDGNKTNNWYIFPMYDFAHPIEDALENITHSLCSLEFEDHRPLYNWVIENIDTSSKPRQIEFARLSLSFTIMSKRKLSKLVEEKVVSGWDDPRMPTISGLKKRGYTPLSIRSFCEKIGVSKVNSTVDYMFLEHCLREDLNINAKRVMAVLNPIKLIITNYPENTEEEFEIENNPNRPEDGVRKIIFSREIYVESDDFMIKPIKKYFRLFPGNEVRLKSTYIVKCTGYKITDNKICEIYAEYDRKSRGGKSPDGRKVKSTIHWVNVKNSINAVVKLYENLFLSKNPESNEKGFLKDLNPNSLKILNNCKVENCLSNAEKGETFQFMRLGYFTADSVDKDKLIFNRSVTLKDSYKI